MQLTDTDPAELRRHIALVPQDTAIFAMSVRDNIRFGRPDASDAAIEDAAEDAAAARFIREMPQGYDAPVGERGVRSIPAASAGALRSRARSSGCAVAAARRGDVVARRRKRALVQTALTRLIASRATLHDRAPAGDRAVLRPHHGARPWTGSSRNRARTTAWSRRAGSMRRLPTCGWRWRRVADVSKYPDTCPGRGATQSRASTRVLDALWRSVALQTRDPGCFVEPNRDPASAVHRYSASETRVSALLALHRARGTPRARCCPQSSLPSHPVERVRPAAAQRDREKATPQ